VAFDSRKFRQVMSQFASGVTVVTTSYEGRPQGLTVASFCSLSLDPPLVLVCIDKRSVTHDILAKAGIFAVNILESEQQDISRTFADPAMEGRRFAEVRYRTGESGAPILEPCLASIDCRVEAMYEGGDHTIFVGRVLDLDLNEDAEPLVYFRSAYHELNH
jgi:flavin reductase (DIM6/NTAB) family NADH-FMN oxidoreductase RutF